MEKKIGSVNVTRV